MCMNTTNTKTMIQPQWIPKTRGRQAASSNWGMIWEPFRPSQGPPWSHWTTPMTM